MPQITFGTVVRILLASLLVGMAMAFFGVQPADIVAWLNASLRDVAANAESWIGWTVKYVLLGGGAIPLGEAVPAEAGEVHQVDVLHVGALAQMRHQRPERGGLELGPQVGLALPRSP